MTKSPGFALTSVAALALGVGANTAIFSLVNQLLLNPPGIADPDRIVAVRVKYDKLAMKSISISAPDFADIRNSTQAFARAALMDEGDFNYTGGELPERLQGAKVSVQWFDVFGARPILGRIFQPEEDLPNGNPVVVLSHATWKRLFGQRADPNPQRSPEKQRDPRRGLRQGLGLGHVRDSNDRLRRRRHKKARCWCFWERSDSCC